MFSIYEIRNSTTGFRYIGYSENVTLRWKEHRRHLEKGIHHNIHLQRAWNKYGEGVFQWTILNSYEDKQSALLEEVNLIESQKNIYNVAAGGRGGNWAKNLSADRKAEIHETFSKSRHKRYQNPDERAKCNSFRNLTQEERLARLETWSKVKKGSKNGNYKHSTPILQLDKVTQKVVREWADLSEAGRSGYERRYVMACCEGKKGFNSHKGFLWKWKK